MKIILDPKISKERVVLKRQRRFYFKPKLNLKLLLTIVIVMLLIVFAIPLTLRQIIIATYAPQIYTDMVEIPETRVAIVFGAGLTDYAKKPSAVLEDRILTAVELYKLGKVQKIIMSGDNRFEDYNEPQVMVDFAVSQGVPLLDLQPDYAGRRTYDTCYRAKEIFGLSKAILITQEFHLPRAMYLCDSLGIESIGMAADKRLYDNIDFFNIRDSFALALAFFELNVTPPEVVLGEKINI